MKRFDQWMMPDNEEHLQLWMNGVNMTRHGRLTYQAQKYESAVKFCKQRRVAVDVGAHIGLWSFMMVHDFERVVCFEPMPEHVQCWRANMEPFKNAELIAVALGKEPGTVAMQTYTKDSSGDTRVNPNATGETPILKLDDIFVHDALDFMKIDCEGFELFVLEGGRALLEKHKPVVVVEQKRDMSEHFGIPKLAALDYLTDLGAVQLGAEGGDYIMGWVE